MPGDLRVPGAMLRAVAPVPFAVFDEAGTDVTALFSEEAGDAEPSKSTVTVLQKDALAFRTHLLVRVRRITGNSVDDAVRSWLLQRSLLFEVEATLEDGGPSPARGLLEITRSLAKEAGSWAGSDSIPSYRHRERVAAEFSTVTHAANAALYAISLAAAAGETSPEVLQGIALAAVFADVAIDQPTDAARIDRAAAAMRMAGVASVAAASGVLGRWARWDGSGTPTGLVGSAIPFEARCTTIASDYDLLTLTGGCGEGLAAYEALSHMAQLRGVYEPALLRVFVRLLGRMSGEDAASIVRSRSESEARRFREMARSSRNS